MSEPDFLPGVPAEHVRCRLTAAGGKEIESGKLLSEESSAALAVNCFGWFVERPQLLPPFPGVNAGSPAQEVDVEYCARFPWKGGRHPWLDAAVVTSSNLIGIESKRFEPFRDTKTVSLSSAYDRAVWGPNMGPFEMVRDRLRNRSLSFVHLDAAQLVKHAFGLVTEGRRLGKRPVLLYLFAEPASRAGRPIEASDIARHRTEIGTFAAEVAGAEVGFSALSYREWIETWPSETEQYYHGQAVLRKFQP